MAPGFEWVQTLESLGIEWRTWALAWARCAPVVVLVPAFGLRAMPGAVRAAIGISLAAVLVPTVSPIPSDGAGFGIALAWQAAQGIPIAIAAAVPLWAATMAGGLVDTIRAGREVVDLPVVDSPTGALGAMWSLLASALFLNLGGPARVMESLLHPAPSSSGPLLRAVSDLTGGIHIAVAIAAPLVAAALVVDLASAMLARAASPAPVGSAIVAVRSVLLLALAGLLFDRMARLVADAVRGGANW